MVLLLIFVSLLLIFGGAIYLLFFSEQDSNDNQSSTLPVTPVNNMLQKWNEQEISMDLIRLQDKPQIFRHYIDSIKQRFIDN